MQVASAPSMYALIEDPSVNLVPSTIKRVSLGVMVVTMGELASSASYLQFEVTEFAQSYLVDPMTS